MRGNVLELMRKGVQALEAKAQTYDLLKVLQSEINHELSTPYEIDQVGPPEGFSLEWDEPYSQDVVLRKKCETGEEVAISSFIVHGHNTSDQEYPMDVMMKVCIRKPGLPSFLQFNCVVSAGISTGPEYSIYNAPHLQLSSLRGPNYYTGPLFSELDPDLQSTFKEYLEARGVGGSLMNFLLPYMHRKEQNQYINWLQKLEKSVSEDEPSDSS